MECSEYRNLRDPVPTPALWERGRVSSCANVNSYTLKRKSTGWQSGRSAIAAPIVTAPVGELSVRYDDTMRSWEMMTLD